MNVQDSTPVGHFAETRGKPPVHSKTGKTGKIRQGAAHKYAELGRSIGSACKTLQAHGTIMALLETSWLYTIGVFMTGPSWL
jgi:hypothetical protein